jgi:hypothetical protein
MQESKGRFMANEAREKIEAPQNYGFTSVVMDATKDALGNILSSAETFVQFMGGNRSFPVFGNMDDRRHRLIELAKGDVAMFRTALDKLQMHMNKDGWFATGPRDKTVRMQLLDEDSGQQQSQSGAGSPGGHGQLELFDATTLPTTNVSAGGLPGGQQQMGQKARYQDGQKSYRFVDVTKDATRSSGKEVHIMLDDGQIYAHIVGKEVYLGGKKGQGVFGHVGTDKGISMNVYARVS